MSDTTRAYLLYSHSLGDVTAETDGNRLVSVTLHHGRAKDVDSGHAPALIAKLQKAFERYFAGRHETFGGVELDLSQGTPFQQTIWRALREVPWGTGTSYGALAERARHPRAARAAGQAVGANPFPIVVPCHRVLAVGGGLGGFSCGLDWKRALLNLEGLPFREPPSPT